METQMGENHKNILIYISILQPQEAPNSNIYHHQLEGGINPLIYMHQPGGSSNSLFTNTN
jgi:hypothetical protein